MHAIKTFITLSALVLGASSYALNHGHSLERDVAVHRRHTQGANLAARAPVANPNASIPVFGRAQRRSMRQKRCIASSSSSSSSSTDNGNDNTNSQSTTTDSNPPATTSSGNGNSGGGSSGSATYTGELTFYDVGLGACGGYNTDSDMIAAASELLYDGFDGYDGGNPNDNPICNKQVSLTYQGKTITVTIVDRCVGCAIYDLDLAPAAFDQLADPSEGRLYGATWSFIN